MGGEACLGSLPFCALPSQNDEQRNKMHAAVSASYRNKIRQTGWFKPRAFIFHWYWRLEVHDQGAGKFGSGEGFFLTCRELSIHYAVMAEEDGVAVWCLFLYGH